MLVIIIVALAVALCVGRVFRGLFTGEIMTGGSGRYRIANRGEQPLLFWFAVVYHVGFATVILCGVIGRLLR